jgi:hypothetical protein
VKKPPDSQISVYTNGIQLQIDMPQLFFSISPSLYQKLLLVVFIDILAFVLIIYGYISSFASIKLNSFAGFILWLFLTAALSGYIIDELMSNSHVVINSDKQIKFKRDGYVRKIGFPPDRKRILSIIKYAQISNTFPLRLPLFQILQLKCQNKTLNLSWLLTKDENRWLEYEINNFLDSVK